MLSARLFLAIYETSGGTLIADFQTRARGLEIGFNEHGAAAASWSVPCGLFEAFSLYARCMGRHCEISAVGHPVWIGRVEDIKMTADGLAFAAYGYQRAFSDVPFSQFWSATRTDIWETVYTSQVFNRYPERYRLSTDNGLYLALQRGDTYGNLTHIGSLMYRIPDDTARQIYAISFDWEITLPTNWRLGVDTCSAAYGSFTPVTIATGNGATQTGTYSATLTQNDIVMVSIGNATGANYTATGETGTQYARITNLRIKGTTSAALYADEIIRAMVADVVSSNATQNSGSWALIQSPGIDLRDEIYQDQYPADILDYLVSLGDNQTPPRQWVWGVDIDQSLYFQPRGTGRQWYVDIGSPDIEQTIENLFNSIYSIYQDANGRAARNTISTDATSVQQYGITRRRAINVQTTNATQAGTHRDAALADGKAPRPRVGIETRAIYTQSGMRVHPWVVRPGDVISIRNLPPIISADVDRLRTFVLSEIKIDADSGTAKLTPESPTPGLDVMVAREAAGVNRAPTVLRPPIVIR